MTNPTDYDSQMRCCSLNDYAQEFTELRSYFHLEVPDLRE